MEEIRKLHKVLNDLNALINISATDARKTELAQRYLLVREKRRKLIEALPLQDFAELTEEDLTHLAPLTENERILLRF